VSIYADADSSPPSPGAYAVTGTSRTRFIRRTIRAVATIPRRVADVDRARPLCIGHREEVRLVSVYAPCETAGAPW
jgi:hypothetical protein